MFRDFFSVKEIDLATNYSKELKESRTDTLIIESQDGERNKLISILTAYLHGGLFVVLTSIMDMNSWAEQIQHIFEDLICLYMEESKKMKKIFKEKKKYKLVVLIKPLSFMLDAEMLKRYKNELDGIIIDDCNFIKEEKKKNVEDFSSLHNIPIIYNMLDVTKTKHTMDNIQYITKDVYISMSDEEYDVYVDKLDKVRHAYKMFLSNKKFSINDIKKKTSKACFERHLFDIQYMSTYVFHKGLSEHDENSILNAKEGCKLNYIKDTILHCTEKKTSLIVFSKYLLPLLIVRSNFDVSVPLYVLSMNTSNNEMEEISTKMKKNDFIIILFHLSEESSQIFKIYYPIDIITLSSDLYDQVMSIINPIIPCVLCITNLCVAGTYDSIRWTSFLGCKDTDFQMIQWFSIVYDMWMEISETQIDEYTKNLQMEKYEYTFFNNLL